MLFPLHERLKGHGTVAQLKRLERSQWWQVEDLERYRRQRLVYLLQSARRLVPYYRDLLRTAGEPRDAASTLQVLADLPFLTKSVIREQGSRMIAESATKLRHFSTGGSTGEPLRFQVGVDRVTHDVAAKWRATRWWGVDIGDPEVVLWGSPIELGTQDRARWLRDRILRTHLLPAFRMSVEQMTRYLQIIRQVRPAIVFGYPSAIALLATHARDTRSRLDDVGVRVVFCTGETLLPDHREVIETVFGAPVANGYGSREAGFIAHECPQGSLHVSAEDIIVEVVDESGRQMPAGVEGELVVTHLATAAFPMVRYKTGDIGVMSVRRCDCGRTLPVLAEVRGRSTDMIRTADGNIMHGLALIYVLRECPGVAAFKIVQKTLQSVQVFIVPGAGYGPLTDQRIREGLRARMGEATAVDVQVVPQIQPERSGKYRYVVSEVRQ